MLLITVIVINIGKCQLFYILPINNIVLHFKLHCLLQILIGHHYPALQISRIEHISSGVSGHATTIGDHALSRPGSQRKKIAPTPVGKLEPRSNPTTGGVAKATTGYSSSDYANNYGVNAVNNYGNLPANNHSISVRIPSIPSPYDDKFSLTQESHKDKNSVVSCFLSVFNLNQFNIIFTGYIVTCVLNAII